MHAQIPHERFELPVTPLVRSLIRHEIDRVTTGVC